jgi:hypothetical protein
LKVVRKRDISSYHGGAEQLPRKAMIEKYLEKKSQKLCLAILLFCTPHMWEE